MPPSALPQKIHELCWSDAWKGSRLKEVLRRELPDLGSRGALLAVTNGLVRLASGTVLDDADVEVPEGENLSVDLRHGIHGPGKPRRPRLHDRLQVLHDDEQLVVVSKRPFTPVQPVRGDEPGSPRARTAPLVELLKHYWRARGGKSPNPVLVQRLDLETSGLIVLAKEADAGRTLQKQLRPPRRMTREYFAFVSGHLPQKKGRWESFMARNRQGLRCSVAVGGSGADGPRGTQYASTRWEVVREFRGYTLLKVTLDTGRTHQIRIHCAEAGHPVLGEQVYGKLTANVFERIDKEKMPPQPKTSPFAEALRVREAGAPSAKPPRVRRVALHATRLSFVHPRTRKRLTFEDPLPEDLKSLDRSGG